jgi:hypothetical protein
MNAHSINPPECSPLPIVEGDWPIVAEVTDDDSNAERPAMIQWRVTIREHADGTRIVHSSKCTRANNPRGNLREMRGGYLLIAPTVPKNEQEIENETVRAIQWAAGIIERDDLGACCVTALPAVVIN